MTHGSSETAACIVRTCQGSLALTVVASEGQMPHISVCTEFPTQSCLILSHISLLSITCCNFQYIFKTVVARAAKLNHALDRNPFHFFVFPFCFQRTKLICPHVRLKQLFMYCGNSSIYNSNLTARTQIIIFITHYGLGLSSDLG